MERLKALVRKEFIQVFRDRVTLAMMVGMPIVQLLIFGFAINTDVKHLPTALYDLSLSQESRQMVDSFTGSNYFDITRIVRTFPELNEAVDRGDVKVGIAFAPDFAARIKGGRSAQVQVIVDASDSMSASSAISVATMLGVLGSQRVMREQLTALGVRVPDNPIDVRVRPWYNEDFVTAWYMVPGIIGILLMMTLVLMMGVAIVRESEQGTLEQLLVTPMRPFELLLSKILPYVIISYVQITVSVLVGVFVFEMPFRGSILLFFALTFFFVVACLGLGIMISTLAQNQMQALQLSIFVMIPSILLSGFIFPIAAMPKLFQGLSLCFPMTFYLRIARQIILKGSGFAYVWRDTAALAAYVAVVFVVSIRMFKKRYVP